jgi:hypothetical protein
MKTSKKIYLTLCALLSSFDASALEERSAPQLVRQAIAEGRAAGLVAGPVAEESRRRLGATGPLTLVVQRVYLFEQPDCARVQLDFTQEAALLPGTAMPSPYSWSTQLNVCSDGQPPSKLTRRNK